MRVFIGIILYLLLTTDVAGQSLKIVDKANLQPIEHVAVFNLDHSKTALTNSIGEADISSFNNNDTLYFQHPSYQDFILTYADVKAMGFSVGLNKSTVNLSEFVVSASKWEQKREEVPNKITTIKVKEVEFLNPQTTADLLGNTNEVFIQKSQLGGGSPMIRGFAANSVLLVVDGVRMNNAIYRSGNLQNAITIDPNIIENAEVIFGPGSIIYGSDALGGVMDFHTRKIELGTIEKPFIKTNALLRYATANNEKTAHVDFNYGGKKWGSLTSISFSEFDDLKMGSVYHEDYQRFDYVEREGDMDKMVRNSDPNIQKFSGYNQLNLMQKLTYKPSATTDLTYTFHYSTSSDIPRYDRLIEYKNDSLSQLKYAEWYYGPQGWMMHNLQLNLNK
ncbi:MAG: TonB-dependent receptor plug domain-containing protein, partial [Bacteroidales bacterium]|nr:TonB-dependent receptor plug domain-containing protein [Bacteroidales bacterium]